jgi:hypothetical protein
LCLAKGGRSVCGVWRTEFLDVCCWRIFYRAGARAEYPVCAKTGIGHGVKKGYLAATGVFIGDAVLMFLAWAGVAALIQTTPVLFNIVRYLGAFYLLAGRQNALVGH